MTTTRVMWLLNHTTLRNFEIDQLRACGVAEVFLPKRFPFDEGNLSASVDYSQDAGLTIPRQDLAVLNAQDWYGCPSEQAWAIANRYFNVAIIGFFPRQIEAAVRKFQGGVVLRVFGLAQGYSYSQLLYDECGETLVQQIMQMGSRFWFGAGYAHLKVVEAPFLGNRDCYLPVGLAGEASPGEWQGQEGKILFVCPRIGTSPYFAGIYRDFIQDFAGFDYSIAGAQPVAVADPNVLGFVTAEQHAYNMRQHKLMFYHSSEPNHIHYHPFEAVRLGMPLLFMAGGMLDQIGGLGLAGRCTSIAQARKKARRILGGDQAFIEQVRRSQMRLLEPMSVGQCSGPWRAGFSKVLGELDAARQRVAEPRRAGKRIAVILPVGYRGGSLRGAKLIAQALQAASLRAGEAAQVVLLHLDDPAVYDCSAFDDLPAGIALRAYHWKYLDQGAARRAMTYAGHTGWRPGAERYKVAEDGVNALQDCDVWVVVSDRLDVPLLPIRPVVLMVFDYLQRYVSLLPHGADQPYLDAARRADRVMVTTDFTQDDALQYAGVEPRKLSKVPMLAPHFVRSSAIGTGPCGYFIWTTNAGVHKNHLNALKALQLYYDELDGQLACHVTGVDTRQLFKGSAQHPTPLQLFIKQQPTLGKKLKVLGELAERAYQQALSHSAFLWHAGAIDNGTFSVIEAASLGVPALSSDYPAMREIDRQFSLNLCWMNPQEPAHMAARLKHMECYYQVRRAQLPSAEVLDAQSIDNLAAPYWQVVSSCL